MRQFAILADDLTGASDAGVQFARKGLTTIVLFDTHNLAADTAGVAAAAVDTDSRALPPQEAHAVVLEAAERVAGAGFRHIYKKLDSTLRGNPGAEIDAVLDAVSFDFALVAPAFPRLGRTTEAGRHYVNGIPVDQTEIARDPRRPVRESYVPALLAEQSRRRVGLLGLEAVRGGAGAVMARVAELMAGGTKLIVSDALTDQDLAAVAAALAGGPWRVLWAGSAGLAEFLPTLLGAAGVPADPAPGATAPPTPGTPAAPGPSGRPVLLVAGSVSGKTREQVGLLRDSLAITTVELTPAAILPDGARREAELGRCADQLVAALDAGSDAVLTTAGSPEAVQSAQAEGEALGLSPTAVAERVAASLGAVTAAVVERCGLSGLVLTGGDTAKAVCRRLGVTGLELIRELEAGVPLSRLVGRVRLPAVTKAGAFGQTDTLLRAVQALKGEA